MMDDESEFRSNKRHMWANMFTLLFVVVVVRDKTKDDIHPSIRMNRFYLGRIFMLNFPYPSQFFGWSSFMEPKTGA